MAKTPVAKPNVPVAAGKSPSMPAVFIQQTPANLGGAGAASPFSGPREDGPHAYSNYDVTPIYYNGQTQTKTAAIAPSHPVNGPVPPGKNAFPSSAKGMSALT